jgi:beta-lactamase class D
MPLAPVRGMPGSGADVLPRTHMKRLASASLVLAATVACAPHTRDGPPTPPLPTSVAHPRAPAASCFLLHELGIGEVRRSPAEGCSTRVTPASTFKIPHALAALDSGVLPGPEARFPYDGSAAPWETWKRDHTLATAMRYSVVWYFQRVAAALGADREREYLARLDYGNRDASSGLVTFWLGESLRISPDEQESFLLRLYEDALPVSKAAMRAVREILVQPPGVVVNASGEHPFDAPWPDGAVVSAKTGSADEVRWLVGHVARQRRSWVFVSCVTGADLDPLAAIDLAAKSLRAAGVL